MNPGDRVIVIRTHEIGTFEKWVRLPGGTPYCLVTMESNGEIRSYDPWNLESLEEPN